MQCISCKKEREDGSGGSDVDVDDGNIYVGSFCPKITTMMMAARVSPHHNHHRHKWQPCVSRRLLMWMVMGVACVSNYGYDDVDDDGGSLV